jgi:hypothetical protein
MGITAIPAPEMPVFDMPISKAQIMTIVHWKEVNSNEMKSIIAHKNKKYFIIRYKNEDQKHFNKFCWRLEGIPLKLD